ncbi:MAG: hypothetical protein ACC662_08815 [Planctomycetota bacterium]
MAKRPPSRIPRKPSAAEAGKAAGEEEEEDAPGAIERNADWMH